MPRMSVASDMQRNFFAALSKVNHLVLGLKNFPDSQESSLRQAWPHGDSASVNAHGRFFLFDKYWPQKQDPGSKHETLIAFSPGHSCDFTESGEPLVHIHVDWTQIRWAKVDEPAKTSIGAYHQIVLAREQNRDSRCIWFYYYRPEDIAPLKEFEGRWVNLEAPSASQGTTHK